VVAEGLALAAIVARPHRPRWLVSSTSDNKEIGGGWRSGREKTKRTKGGGPRTDFIGLSVDLEATHSNFGGSSGGHFRGLRTGLPGHRRPSERDLTAPSSGAAEVVPVSVPCPTTPRARSSTTGLVQARGRGRN